MHIQVSTITGKKIKVNCEDVNSLQKEIETQTGIPVNDQKLIFNNKKIILEESLESQGIYENSEIHMLVELEGGAKGKKKKKEVKKKKPPHHKKKIKLQILKYYKVEGNKVVRQKQMCKVCPPGTFLADHPDRLFCGRCKVAYTKVADKGAKKEKGEKGGKKEKKGKK